jgi:hypothetical protein
MYTNTTAKSMTAVLTASESGPAPNTPSVQLTISLAHANTINDMTVAAAPPTMNGRRLPHLLRQPSLLMPTYGCTTTPDSGPAIQTKASSALLSPSESRYGEPFDISTDQPIWSPNAPSVSKSMYQLDLVLSSSLAYPASPSDDTDLFASSCESAAGYKSGDCSSTVSSSASGRGAAPEPPAGLAFAVMAEIRLLLR